MIDAECAPNLFNVGRFTTFPADLTCSSCSATSSFIKLAVALDDRFGPQILTHSVELCNQHLNVLRWFKFYDHRKHYNVWTHTPVHARVFTSPRILDLYDSWTTEIKLYSLEMNEKRFIFMLVCVCQLLKLLKFNSQFSWRLRGKNDRENLSVPNNDKNYTWKKKMNSLNKRVMLDYCYCAYKVLLLSKIWII